MKDTPLTACEALRFELISSEEPIETVYLRLWKLYAFYRHGDVNGVWHVDPYLSFSFVKLCTGFNYDKKLLEQTLEANKIWKTTISYGGTWHRVYRCRQFGIHKPRAMELAAFEEIKDKKRLDR